MVPTVEQSTAATPKPRLDRVLSLVTDVRAGEGMTAVLMLANIFLLLVCYSVIKTVREPLILLGGGAEVRSYAAAGQALLLIGFVPLYSWFASRVDRVKLLVGVTLFFIACIELFAFAVATRVPYIGVAFFIWVGIFNISLVAQFWSFANDVYSKEAGARLFPIIVVGMTAGAPLGSFIAARLFQLGLTPQVILQVSAGLLALSTLLYLVINRRETTRSGRPEEALTGSGGFNLVMSNPYLRSIALLVVLLNVVNTTGEYLVARLLTAHVNELVLLNPDMNKQAFIGAFSGDYQFWVNITALLLQALVTSRLVKYAGLRGALLALPLIALGGYGIIAAGAGFSIVRWIKTAENATDYSVMNTARQMLWLPTTREEKYKAKQAIDTFFVRTGDLLSAAVVYTGTSLLNLTVSQFATVNVVLTLAWIGVAVMILSPRRSSWTWRPQPKMAAAAAAVVLMVVLASPAFAQETREELLAAQRAEKATALRPYEPDALEKKIERLDRALFTQRPVYTFMGSAFEGGGLTLGPGFRGRFGDSGAFDVHGGWSIRNFKVADARLRLPAFADGRLTMETHANWLDAPNVAFYGLGNSSSKDARVGAQYRSTTVGVSARLQAAPVLAVGGGFDYLGFETDIPNSDASLQGLNPNYRKSGAFVEVDTRTSPDYSRTGGLYRIDVADYRQVNAGRNSFQRIDAEARQFIPVFRENWGLALRALTSSTLTADGESVPYFLMPELGGSHYLRGYSYWRFRDRNRLLFSGEYRWTAGPLVDMAVFVEAGKVAGRFSDLNLRNLKTSHGLGFTVHTPSATVTRIEIARSSEGTSLLLSFSPSF